MFGSRYLHIQATFVHFILFSHLNTSFIHPVRLHQSYPCMISQVKQLSAWFPCLPLWQTCNIFHYSLPPFPHSWRITWLNTSPLSPCPCWLRFLLLLPVTLLRIPNTSRSQYTETWHRNVSAGHAHRRADSSRGEREHVIPFPHFILSFSD